MGRDSHRMSGYLLGTVSMNLQDATRCLFKMRDDINRRAVKLEETLVLSRKFNSPCRWNILYKTANFKLEDGALDKLDEDTLRALVEHFIELVDEEEKKNPTF